VNEEIVGELRTYIAGQILKQPGREIAADEALISGGLIDSFSLVDLAMFVEQTWGVRIDDTELNAESFDTLNELAGIVEARKG
jgi:acyl carrier protein